jgi:hypothetical protein
MNIKPKSLSPKGLVEEEKKEFFSLSPPPPVFPLSYRTCDYLFESQRSILMDDLHGAIALILDYHLGGPRPLFDLIKLIMMGHGKVISMSPLSFHS